MNQLGDCDRCASSRPIRYRDSQIALFAVPDRRITIGSIMEIAAIVVAIVIVGLILGGITIMVGVIFFTALRIG